MFKRLLISWVVLAIAIGLVASLLPGFHINGGALTLLWVAALYGVVNVTLGSILALLTLPLVLLSLGLFTFVINAALFELIDWMSSSLTIDTFWWSLLAAFLVTVFTMILTFVLHLFRRREQSGRVEPKVA